MTSVAGVGFWEHVDLLNLVAPFLEASAIGALSCTCRFARDNLHDPMQLRWLAELRGLDPEQSGISSVEHIHIAEALSSMQTSVAFEYQSVRLVPAALPSVRRVADLLLQHTSLSISVEAHCGLEAPTDAGRHFTKLRALAVKRAMERHAHAQGGADFPLRGRIITRAWSNTRPLVWATAPDRLGSRAADPGAANRRVELFLKHGDFEAPRRRHLNKYARRPGSAPPPWEGDEVAMAAAQREATQDATFGDGDDSDSDDSDDDEPTLVLQLPDGRQVAMPPHIFQQLQGMDPAEILPGILAMINGTN